jgi:hypothetical protein
MTYGGCTLVYFFINDSDIERVHVSSPSNATTIYCDTALSLLLCFVADIYIYKKVCALSTHLLGKQKMTVYISRALFSVVPSPNQKRKDAIHTLVGIYM